MSHFLRGHVEAFAELGIARTLLYDNLRSAVLERVGEAIISSRPRVPALGEGADRAVQELPLPRLAIHPPAAVDVAGQLGVAGIGGAN